MATATKKTAGKTVATTEKKAVAPTASAGHATADQLPANIGMEQYAHAGFESADRDSYAIPFLAVIQKGSPQVDKDDDVYIEGLEVGDLMLTASGEIFKDEDGADLIFCGYRRAFLRYEDNDGQKGGFKGEISVDDAATMRAKGELTEGDDGKTYHKSGDIIRDTRIHYVLVLRADGTAVPAVLSLASTQIKKSKLLMANIGNFAAKNSAGKSFTPPMFAHVFHAETVAESNDKGSWRGWKFTRTGFVNDPELFDAAVKFYEAVKGETVRVDFNAEQSDVREDDDSDV